MVAKENAKLMSGMTKVISTVSYGNVFRIELICVSCFIDYE